MNFECSILQRCLHNWDKIDKGSDQQEKEGNPVSLWIYHCLINKVMRHNLQSYKICFFFQKGNVVSGKFLHATEKGRNWKMERMKQTFLFQGFLWLSHYWCNGWSCLLLGSFSLLFLIRVICEFLIAKSLENLGVEIYLLLLLWFRLNCFVWKSKIKLNKN